MTCCKKGTPYDKLSIMPFVYAEGFLNRKGIFEKEPKWQKWCKACDDLCRNLYNRGDFHFSKFLRGVRVDPRDQLEIWLEHWYQSFLLGEDRFYDRMGCAEKIIFIPGNLGKNAKE